MATHRLKHSFSAGELSPLMEARTDFKRFNNGCLKLQNMKCTTQGPVTRRVGTEFIVDLTGLVLPLSGGDTSIDVDEPIRTIPFIFNEIQSYVMIFARTEANHDIVLFANNGSLLTNSDSIPYDSVEFDGSIDTYSFEYPGLASLTRFYFVRETDGTLTEIALADYTEATASPNAIDCHIDVDTYPAGVLECQSKDISAGVPISVELSTTGDFDIEYFDYAQSADEVYIASANYEPFIISRNAHTNWSKANTGISFSGDQGVDGKPHWDDTFGWPETVTFHQQRLIFGGTAFYRQTVWTSASNSFDNFDITAGSSGTETTALASDPIQFTLDADTQNKIRWVSSGKALLIGTLGNEWTVTGSTISALTSTNILAQRQTNLGSERVTPLMVGITTLFIERFGRTINEFVYDFNTDSYKTSDMSILSKHVTDYYPIKYWDYQQTPDSVIWSVREDGILLGTTYQRQHEVIGWHVHNTDGLFKTVTCIPGQNREDEVWTVVQRTVSGEEKLYLELFAQEYLGHEASDGHFLDCHIHANPATFSADYAELPEAVEFQPIVYQSLPDISYGQTVVLRAEVTYIEPYNNGPTPPFLYIDLWGRDAIDLTFLARIIVTAPGSYIELAIAMDIDYRDVIISASDPGREDNGTTVYGKSIITSISCTYNEVEQVVNPNFVDQTGWLLDGGATIVNSNPVPAIEDLSHLENKEVAIINNGVVEESQTVVGGKVYLPNASVEDDVLVGLNYISEVWPTIKDIDQRDGTSAGRVQRITNLDFDLYEAGSFWSGRWSADGEQEEYISFEIATDDPLVQIPLFTGIKHYEFPEGYDRDATYFIKQKQPLPLTVRAVVDTIEVYK